MRRIAIILTVLSLTVCATASFSQGIAKPRDDLKVEDHTFRDVAGDLRCPTCTGLSVLDSDASFSIQIKNEVKEQLAAGKSKDEILNFFTDRYGPWILRVPPKEGVHVFAWIIPIAVLILGPIIIWLTVWSRRRRFRTDELVTRTVDDVVTEMHEKLEQLRGKDAGAKR